MKWVLFRRGARTIHPLARQHWHGTTLSSAFKIIADGFRVGHGIRSKKTGWFGISSHPFIGADLDSYSRRLALERASIHRSAEWKDGCHNAWAVPVVTNVGLDSACKLDNFKRFPKHLRQVLRGDIATLFTWVADIEIPLELWIPLPTYERFQLLDEMVPRILQGTYLLCSFNAREKRAGLSQLTTTCGRTCATINANKFGRLMDDDSWLCQPCAYWKFSYDPFHVL